MMAMRRTAWLIVALLVLGAVCRLVLRSNVQHDAARQFPWPVPDYRLAEHSHVVLPDGRIRLNITHLPLAGISPDMLNWWYRELPIAQVRVNGKMYPFYHLFHLTEHGRIWLEEPAFDGKPGMGVGALVARREWFGSYESAGAGRISEMSAQGMAIHPEIAGIAFGTIRHGYQPTPDGSRYTLQSTIGVDWPIVAPAINALLRKSQFPDAMLVQWERHQIEEVAMLNYFLPELYSQRNSGHYHLEFAESALLMPARDKQ